MQNDINITGAQAVIKGLEREGIDTVFAYPGNSSLMLHQALLDSSIRVVLPRHEQGAAFAAGGYARISGRTGVCMATSGPGATNLVTGIADAWNDSVPLLAITAQVNQRLIGKNAFQETDIIGMTRLIVKHSYLVLNANELPQVIKDAVHLTRTGRPGPVVIDITSDVLSQLCSSPFPDLPSLNTYSYTPEPAANTLNAIYKALCKCQRPCIYAGGGIICADASRELRSFAEAWNIPVATTLMGLGAFPSSHPLSLRMLGFYGDRCANKVIRECDLLLVAGARFSDRVTGEVNSFAPKATIIHIDIDDSEINKNKHADLSLTADAKKVLACLATMHPVRHHRKEWLEQIKAWRDAVQPVETQGPITPERIIHLLNKVTDSRATLVTGVGLHQLAVANGYDFHHPRQLLTSGGLGAMGFGLPAAIGAQIACPERQIILIDGDGSFQMNIQELATAFAEQLPIKIIIVNNSTLGMIAMLENRLCHGRHAQSDLSVSGRCYPDFVTIAKGYGISARRIEMDQPEQLEGALQEMLAATSPYLLDIHTPAIN